MAKAHFLIIFSLASLLTSVFANCDPGWTEYNGHCYKFENQLRKSWEDAEETCNSHMGHLVAFETQEENEWVYQWWVSMLDPLEGERFEYYWTGYNDIEEEGEWVWSNGSPTTFTRWGGHQPDGGESSNCATMITKYADEDGKWDDAKCTGKHAYICETSL